MPVTLSTDHCDWCNKPITKKQWYYAWDWIVCQACFDECFNERPKKEKPCPPPSP